MTVQGRISQAQYVWMVIGFVFGTAALIFIGGTAEKDAWFALLLGFAEFTVIGLPFLLLSTRFPGMGVSRINDTVWGGVTGKVFTIAFILYTLSLCSVVETNFHNFIQLAVLYGIPDYALDIPTSIAIGLACLYGIEVIGRFSGVVVPAVIVAFLMITILSIPYWDANNIRPALATPLPKLLSVSHGLASFPFGETLVFMALIPCLPNPRKAVSYTYMGAAVGAIVFIGATIRNLGVLGNATPLFAYTAFSAARVINIGGFFTRMELLMALVYILTSGLKAMILLYVSGITTAELLGLKSFRSVIIPYSILMAVLNHNNFPSAAHNFEYAQKLYPAYAVPFQVGIPLLTLLAAVALGKRGSTTQGQGT